MALPSLLGISKSDVVTDIDLTTVEGVIMFYSNKIIEDAKANLASDGSNASYQLSQSIRPEFEITTEKFGVKYTMRILMEEYYEFVDEGRPPGKRPPLIRIENWIRNKEGFKLKQMDKIGDIRERGKNKRKPYTREEIIRGAAFGIAKKIGLNGTRGNNFYANVVNQEFYNNLNKDLSKALKKDVEVTIKNMVDSKEYLVSGAKRF